MSVKIILAIKERQKISNFDVTGIDIMLYAFANNMVKGNTSDKNIKPGDNGNIKEDTQAFLLSLYRIDSQNCLNNRWEKYVNVRFNFY